MNETISRQAGLNLVAGGKYRYRIDYLNVTRKTTSATLYSMWSTAHPWEGIFEQDPTDDPDLDGLANQYEFAFDSSPIAWNEDTKKYA